MVIKRPLPPHHEGMLLLHQDCTAIKYRFWKVLGMEKPRLETLFTECCK